MLYRIFLIGIITILCFLHLSICMIEAFQCGPANVCLPALMPGCDSPIVPIAPCCEPTPLYPPAPPVVAPVIIAPAPLAFAPELPSPVPGLRRLIRPGRARFAHQIDFLEADIIEDYQR